jgi:hypothetical protein
MKLPVRLPALCFIGVLLTGSTALGYYYYYVYSPPLMAAEAFMSAMEARDSERLEDSLLFSVGLDSGTLRPGTEEEIAELLFPPFERGRILDQRKREGKSRTYHYLIYREPDGQLFALVVTELDGQFRVVVPESPMSQRQWYLWDYTWTN